MPVVNTLLTGVAYTTTLDSMDTGLVQQLVRLKLKDGRLPQGGAVGIRESGSFASEGRHCDACDERITPNQKAVLVMVSLQWMSIFFHVDCYHVWDAERLALSERRTSTAENEPRPV
jgi:hypothetical protein